MTDLRIAVRALRRSPGFTVIAILTMAAAIGANTAMFSVFDRLILHAVDVPNPNSLVAIWFNNPQRNMMGRDGLPPVEIVGVIRDVKTAGVNVPVRDEIYLPLRQLPRSGMNVMAKTAGDPSTLQNAVQAAVTAVDKTQAISFFATLESNVSTSFGQQQLLATLTGIFAGLALGLALIGLYSVLAYLVTQRTSEIGIRMALGASRGQVVGLVMRNGMLLVGIGLTIGLVAAAGTSRLIQQLLFGVTPFSPLVYLSVASAFAVIAAAACMAPSLRASRIDPLRACRAE